MIQYKQWCCIEAVQDVVLERQSGNRSYVVVLISHQSEDVDEVGVVFRDCIE